MNKARRERISEAIEQLRSLRDELEELSEEEQEAFDNLPENLQYSNRGELMEEAIGALTEAYESIDDVIDNIEGVIG